MALSLKERIAQEAKALGFAAVRFAGADPPPGAGAALDAFLAEGRHGDMAWLAANRRAPQGAARACGRSAEASSCSA